MSPLLL